MAARNGKAAATAPAKTVDRVEPEEVDEGQSELDAIADLTKDKMDRLLQAVEGKTQIGRNQAVLGFWAKVPGAHLAGVVLRSFEQRSSFNAGMDRILLIDGLALYPNDVVTETEDSESGEVKQEVQFKAGQHRGIWCLRVDAATQAYADPNLVGRTIHAKLKKRERLAGGRTRYAYYFANVE